MMHRLLLLALIVFPTILNAQKVYSVSGEYTYYAPMNVTVSDAKATAIEKARIQALADKFGTLIDMHGTSVIHNTNGKSNSNFFSLGESTVKGEWIADTKEPETSVKIEGDFIVAYAKVWGKAREIVSAPIDITSKLLKTTDGTFDEDRFRHGDDVYLSFSSPVKGYLAVYEMDENGRVNCFLPYAEDEDGQFEVKANKTYILFSEKHAEKGEECTEYVMTCEKTGVVQNMFYIIFSPNKFTKANDGHAVGTVMVNGDELLRPRSVEYADFHKWLSRCRRHDKDMQVVTKPVVISRD